MNSTPSTLARIMRLTAFDPPPPTPITFIFAPFCGSSANDTRMLDSFCAMLPPQSFCRFCFCFNLLLLILVASELVRTAAAASRV